jgi:hypothetical protein
MDIFKLAKLKPQFVTREVGNELILVPLTGNIAQMNKMFTLNETAKLIWENMDKVQDLKELEKIITNEFEIDAVTASADIALFLNHLDAVLLSK